MRASSILVNGCAPGSARAAASISLAVIGRRGRRSGFAFAILREVVVLLISVRSPGRDQTVVFVSFGVDDAEQLAVGHANEKIAILAIVLAFVEDFHHGGITERLLGNLKRDPVPIVVAA